MLEEYLDRENLIRCLQKCIQIKSVKEDPLPDMPYGKGVSRCLRYVLSLANDMGFRTEEVDGQIGYAEYGEGEEMIAVLGHLDVVPEGGGWDYPPYGGDIADGKIYGRGATDDKGPMIAALFALKAVKAAGIPLKRRIRIIFGTDEESGSKDMKRYTEPEEIPVMAFTPDADYPVIFAEKGMIRLRIAREIQFDRSHKLIEAAGGEAVNQVPDQAHLTWKTDGAKKRIDSSKGLSAHGSTPAKGINAIDDMMQKLTCHSSPCHLPAEVWAFAEFYMQYFHDNLDGRKLQSAYHDEELGDFTLNVGILFGNEKQIGIQADCRYPAGFDIDGHMKIIREIAESEGMKFEVIKQKPPLHFPKEHRLIRTLQHVYEAETGEQTDPIAIGGGTYAKSLPNTAAFGPIFPGKENVIHQKNEYISIEDLQKNAAIMVRAMCQLAGDFD